MGDFRAPVNGRADNFYGGSFDVADLATTSTPIVIPGTSTFTKLTNDGLGSQTNSANKPVGINELWNTVDNCFEFDQLKMGDIVDVRLDIDVITASPNTQCEVRLLAGIGIFSFPVGWDHEFYSSSGTYPLVRSSFLAMQTVTILTGVAEFQVAADKACTVVVNGFNYVIRQRG